MGNLKEIRSRIISVKSTRQITSAMKMVSAAKLKKAQDAVINLRPYAKKLVGILQNIYQTIEGESESIYNRKTNIEKILIVAITSNKGLCGAFNANVIKQVTTLINEDFIKENNEGNVSIVSFGKKGSEFFHSKGYKVAFYNNEILDKLSYENALPFIEQVMALYEKNQADKIMLVYNQFKNAGVQVLTAEQFLPIELDLDKDADEQIMEHFDYIFEPTKEYIVQELIPKSLKLKLYETMLESLAAEHGARMTAMHKATDNASEMIKELQLNYNKARQASITNEILEIVGGAEALRK
ncbi:MAG: ATP synthase F1 subunit gamma [Bacteroidetes bacterium GWC2_33_15]|nr:MAG: ATP synthase F1 subunit gamma [Bacteroidetes bacterium GWA2_33_15]OFX50890.1 MAG: ATP synthase F1 subunit gamma [Bacteroidetes bacterium GWC2_33_15]OFX62828.1 MAG: ATP synthase F1 subunit gamma [Bacteroidetes bacterium GWB2_32_14]OFX69897.1 MAG: ATP synthase F1 subunit gamma [Bacteroidetes bacterium GWD2_33_33]HAN18887.1 ATP synthase F1 subunit gamma [Bacteroidales bacterium]